MPARAQPSIAVLQRPRFDRRGVDAEPLAITGQIAHHASTPRTAITARMRLAAMSGIGKQAGRIGKPEQLGKVEGRARALLAADHA